jgi:hypothetical protein
MIQQGAATGGLSFTHGLNSCFTTNVITATSMDIPIFCTVKISSFGATKLRKSAGIMRTRRYVDTQVLQEA